MMRSQSGFKPGKNTYTLLAVICGKKEAQDNSTDISNSKIPKNSSSGVYKAVNLTDKLSLLGAEQSVISNGSRPVQDYADLVTAGQIEVQVLESPSSDELKQRLDALDPEIIYFQGERVCGTDDVGPLELADCQISSPESLTTLLGDRIPEVVCLETAAATKLGEALQKKGVPYVIFWKGPVTFPWAALFRQAFIAVLRSSASQIWNAFHLARASFRFHRGNQKTQGTSNGLSRNSNMNPFILGDPPPKLVEPPRMVKDSGDGDDSPSVSPSVQIYDEEIDLPLLVLGEPRGQDSSAFSPLEDGLNALLTVEVRGMRLLHRVSASPPPSAAPILTRGVVTMRCDLCTSSSARISLLVSGSAQTCFDDQMLEYGIKKELLEKNQLVFSPPKNGEHGLSLIGEPRKSDSVACGATVMEIRFKTSSWAVQVLRQLAPEPYFRSLVALGIAGVQGFPVAAFQKADADLLLYLRSISSRKHEIPLHDSQYSTSISGHIPSWLTPPVPSRKRRKLQSFESLHDSNKSYFDDDIASAPKSARKDVNSSQMLKKHNTNSGNLLAPMKPVPHILPKSDMPYAGTVLAAAHHSWTMKVSISNGASGRLVRPNSNAGPVALNSSSGLPVSHSRQTVRAPSPAQMLSLNPIPTKKHGCNRPSIHECSDEEFRKDVMMFLISRGHTRLVPSTDLEAFPDAVLNGKRLDLYNLYREVVSRGGFHVGNGINWKGQVFSKMRNHTLINKMTGVGNTLKKHYEMYLLEYELAHDDVDGECCILCHSSAAGDWVNCGICGEWAHYGCDKRNGLGAFKEYAKTDGLEYICPRCSASNGRSMTGRRKFRSPAAGLPRPL